MRRTRHPVTRFAAALTALLTVWCLGCSAFDPLFEQLLGGGSAMVCASDNGMGEPHTASGHGAVSAAGDVHAPSSVSAAQEQGSDGVSCGCQSCTASASTAQVAASPDALAPQPDHWLTPVLLDITRAPLVPPPERTL